MYHALLLIETFVWRYQSSHSVFRPRKAYKYIIYIILTKTQKLSRIDRG